MHNPTDQAGASIPTDTTANNNDNDGPDWNRTVKVRRKVAKRTRPFELAVEELDLVPSSAPHAENKPPAKKRPRLEEPLPTTTDEKAAAEISSYDTALSLTASPNVPVGLLPTPAADNNDGNANADLVMDTQTNAGASTWATRRRWTSEEDAKLTSAVTNTSKKKHGKEYKTNWVAISALVPGRTRGQCQSRWHDAWIPASIGRMSVRVNGQQTKTSS
jgi:hypothetical protein